MVQAHAFLGKLAMAAHLTDVGSSTSASGSSPVEDDDVVFVESIQPPICAPAVAEERNFVVTSSKHENPQGNYSIIPPSLRDFTSQKGNICETIVIDDEGDTETDGGEEKNPTNFTEWGPHGNKNSTKNLDFFISSLSRSKTKPGVGPFNPGRLDVVDALQNGRCAAHPNPDSWISQSASFPRNQKQQGMDSLSPVASLPKQNFQPSNQHLTKPVKITCANCKNPLQKGQTAYQRKGSAHLFCSTTCLSSFSHKRTRKTRNVACKNYRDSPLKTATVIPPVESSKSSPEFCTASLSPCEYYQDLRKEVFTKSRCIMCNKLGEVRHEISINSVTHKLCSNNCFNEYRLTNGLIMNCCEQCGKYIPKNTGHKVLISGQQKSFCCQNCASEYKEIMETKSKISLLQNRKRNAVREENERRLYELSTLSEKIGETPEKKEKISEVIEIAAECSLDTSKESHVNSAPETAMPDTIQEHLGDGSSDSGMSGVLSSDPGSWPRILNMKQRDILVKNDPPQIRNFHFPKDNTGRKFSEAYYTRILPSGEKTSRSWLLYSASKDAVFCLYCRLFGEGKNQLRNENGCRDWQHLSHILSKHEESEMHINNSAKYSKLKSNVESTTDDSVDHKLYEDGENGVLLLYT